MGFNEGFTTTMGILLCILTLGFALLVFKYAIKFIRFILPSLKNFAIAHPIWSILIGIFVLAVCIAIIDSVCF